MRPLKPAEGTMGATMAWTLLIVFIILGFPAQSVADLQLQDTSRHLYDRVMEEFDHGDYEAALAGFRLFIELNRKSILAANAQYWIGECQYRLGRYKDALDSFSNVGSYNSLSPKLAASAFKIGQIYSKLGDHERARLMFDGVLNQYPDGAEAKLARKAIDGITLTIGSKPLHSQKNVNRQCLQSSRRWIEWPNSEWLAATGKLFNVHVKVQV
jgi:tol-pal system protein YbgF